MVPLAAADTGRSEVFMGLQQFGSNPAGGSSNGNGQTSFKMKHSHEPRAKTDEITAHLEITPYGNIEPFLSHRLHHLADHERE